MENIKQKIIKKLNDFDNINLFNNYSRIDKLELIKELEQKYNCKIDPTFYTITFNK